MSGIIQRARVARNWLQLRDWNWSKRLAAAAIPPSDAEIRADGRCFLPRVGVDFNETQFQTFASGYRYAAALHQAGATFAFDDGALTAALDGLRVRVETAEELFILHEIFVERVYGYCSERPTAFLDVGANVGFASLFFSSLPNAVAVLGYEPFPETYRAALANLTENPEVAKRVRIENRAVLASNRRCEWSYAPRLRGSVGGFETAPNDAVPTAKATIEAVDAAEVVADALNRHPDAELVLKLDCEGSEYEIVDRLAETRLLSRIAGAMMEWHIAAADHHPSRLTKPLANAGFRLVQLGTPDAKVGMIYAFQNGRDAASR